MMHEREIIILPELIFKMPYFDRVGAVDHVRHGDLAALARTTKRYHSQR